VTITMRRGKYPRATIACRLSLDQFHRFGTDRPELCAAFGILEADAA
jgi:hypothetical protein